MWGAVLNAEEEGGLWENSGFAEYVLENWQTKEKYRELKNQVGNIT